MSTIKEQNRPKPVVLLVMDGWGYREEREGNAVLGHTPHLERYWETYPHTFLHTSGEAVGLPDGQMGNSEVGHMNLGAGFIVYQQLVRINKDIRTGAFYKIPALVGAVEHAKKNNSNLHLMGLIGPGGVHAYSEHLFALLKLAQEGGLPSERVFVHCFMDGRDTAPTSGRSFVEEVESQLKVFGGRIATVSGRYYAMDRDNRWERVKRAYLALTKGEGNFANSADEALARSYDATITDEFVEPTVILTDGKPTAMVQDNDAVVFFNFRSDRARELTKAFVHDDEHFGMHLHTDDAKPLGFARERYLQNLYFATMTEYQEGLPVQVAYDPLDVQLPVAAVVSKAGLKQLHTAETEKYAHVTFFFNGGREEPFPNEERILIASPKVATYDLKPEMSAYEVTDSLLEKLEQDLYDFIIINFANFDMVGHTGRFEAAVKAAEAVDICVSKVVASVLGKGGVLLLTADHGNAEKMIDPVTKAPFTEHTTTPVQCILVSPEGSPYRSVKLRESGIMADVAPTLLQLLNLAKPSEMTQESLITE
ncbi:MAG: 2,3-bisphosphoglycerate-independent phosphoglycerate mutase [Chloroflexi bacterium]|uniref:2,3-bisphosphoglycerate-independent phosphoglycerate mutase n=1 Tax=Candidatus Chlorohelix allophototropha TaxID=3003348 RepID=A0A8T7M2E2_9CHLR|nr:2,3-bisphosphoglycerate-independent phosphoglycerate mutase [Chloroflexota bacterium]WJW67092.1 2,3-bisphosphoglycerate-independent phosphoglycerate mutase [Chloroflexota bacterium L227-S17]